MKKNPILVFTGLAIAAVAGVAGLTRDQWMTGAPQQIAGAEITKAPEAAPAAEQTPAVETPANPAAEQPAATAEVPAEQPAAEATAEAPAEQPAATAEAPAEASAEQPAVEAPAEQQTAAAQPEQPAAAAEPAADAPAQADAPKEDVPSFDTVRIEKSGEAVIAGTAEAGSQVVVKLDGQEIGKTVANADGAFVVVPDAPLPSGSGALTIESMGEGDAAPTQSEESVAVIVPASEEKQDALVALVSPNAPTRVLQKPEPDPEPETETQIAAADPAAEETGAVATEQPAAEQPAAEQPAAEQPAAEQPAAEQPAAKPAKLVSIDAVDYDETGNIVFSGRGEPSNGARVYVDNKFIGDAAVDADGRWSFAGTADIAPGVHALRVDGIDSKGTVINRVEVPFFREESRKVVAAATPAEQPAAEQPEVAVPDQTVTKTEAEAGTSVETPVVAEEQTAAAAATGQPEAAAPAAPKDGRVVIQPGNNLWRISRVLYGSGTKYTLLYQANKDQIRNPDKIYPGQIFMTPDVAPKLETIDPDRRDPLTPEENAASAQ